MVYFTVLLVLPSDKLTNPKVAYHIKIPYIKNRVDFYETQVVTYGGIHNTIYGLAKKDFATYFYKKNGMLYYHRKISGSPQFFWLVPHLNTYKLVEFRKLDYNIKGLENLLIKTDRGEWYIISDGIEYGRKEKCLALIDSTTGQHLFIADQKDSLLLKFFYPLVDSIFPILQVTRNNILLHLFDLPSKKIEVLTWSASDSIRNFVLILLEKALDDSLFLDIKNDTNSLLIKKCEFCCTFYDLEDNPTPNGIGYIDAVIDLTLLGSKYKYLVKNLDIKISISGGHNNIHLNANLGFKSASLQIYDSRNTSKSYASFKYADFFKNSTLFDFLSREFRTTKSSNRVSIHIDNVLYKSKCYYIVQNNLGIRIFEKGNFIGTSIIVADDTKIEINAYASMYSFKGYLIVITNSGLNGIKLIVMDLKNNSIGIWKIGDENWRITHNKWIYKYYYDSLYNRLLFLSSDLKCLFFINVEKMEEALKATNSSECQSKSHRDIKDLGDVFDLNKLIIRSINTWYKSLNNSDIEHIIGLLGYYIDKKIRKLYIIAKYIKGKFEYIGLFVSSLGWQIEFSLMSYIINKPRHSLSYIMPNVKKNFNAHNGKMRSFFKWVFYKIGNNMAKDLDLCYDNDNVFVSISYNRKSNRIVRENSQYNMAIDFSLNIGDMMTIMYKCADNSDLNEIHIGNLGFYCKNSYGFVLADLNLVYKVPIEFV